MQIESMRSLTDDVGIIKRRQEMRSVAPYDSSNRRERTNALDSVVLNPEDSSEWPAERILFFAGFFLFPCWIVGAFRRGNNSDTFVELFRYRCQVMTMIVAIMLAGLIVVESVFKGK